MTTTRSCRFSRPLAQLRAAPALARLASGMANTVTLAGALQKLGVLVKARNCLVFQGDVQAVALKTPAVHTPLWLCNPNHCCDQCGVSDLWRRPSLR